MKTATKHKGLVALGALVFGLALSTAAFAAKTETPKFGSRCVECHDEKVAGFGKTMHGKSWTALGDNTKRDCESCHGNADKHVAENTKETIIRFGKESASTAEEQSKQCIACHKKTPMLSTWEISAHKKNDVSCASCHGVHGDKTLKEVRSAQTCFACHKEVKTQVGKLAHHPVLEGKVVCADCHNPHGTMSHGMIKADNVNQLCYKCHADKRGPFIWEHPPVEENCTTCHSPHGSNHHGLLNSPVPYLCRDCHTSHAASSSMPNANTNFPHSRQTNRGSQAAYPGIGSVKVFMAQGCLNCHSRIHGSNGSTSALVR